MRAAGRHAGVGLGQICARGVGGPPGVRSDEALVVSLGRTSSKQSDQTPRSLPQLGGGSGVERDKERP
jgi:hypothetical protein